LYGISANVEYDLSRTHGLQEIRYRNGDVRLQSSTHVAGSLAKDGDEYCI